MSDMSGSPSGKSYGFLRGWHSVIAKAFDQVSLVKEIEASIGWIGSEGQ